MRKRRQPYRAPDGIDWRDPDMPVSMSLNDRDGSHYIKVVTPDYYKQVLAALRSVTGPPHWSNDPSYNWRRK